MAWTRLVSEQESRVAEDEGVVGGNGRNACDGRELTRPLRAANGVSSLDRWLARQLLNAAGNPPIFVELWNGERVATTEEPYVSRFRIQGRSTLLKVVLDPQLQFGEAYSAGRIRVEGDLVDLMEIVMASAFARSCRQGPAERMLRWLHRPRRCTLAEARQNIHHHYDIGNEFYKLWLDEQLVYTCAYFEQPDMSLEEAQVAKLDHVCRKLRLRPGDHVVEAGCGWGALALHLARHYGVTVRAFNISHEQIVHARKRAKAERLAGRVEFVEEDWRNISGRCDAFVSVGMLEHVGLRNYAQLGNVICRSLKPAGLGLIHTIGRNVARPLSPWTERRIFPGAYPPSLRQMMEIFESAGMSVLDVENIRLHYAKTLEHWLQRFEGQADRVAEMFDERFVRTWRFYLANSVAAFRTGQLQLFQVSFAHAANNQVPWTRADIY